jgi:hypothetical protein
LCLFCLFFLLSPVVSHAACATRTGWPALQPLAADVWWVAAARGTPEASNEGLTAQLLVVRDGSRIWLIGSGPTPAFGARLACSVKSTTGRAVTDVVNTRAAPELAMGNGAFAGARLWALPDVAAAMRLRCGACQAALRAQIGPVAGASLRPSSIHTPTRHVGAAGVDSGVLGPFDWHTLLRAPGERVLVLSHRASGLTLAQGLLWAGDVPDLRQTQALPMLASWRELIEIAAGGLILGEQGGVADATAVDAHLRYLSGLQAAMLPALQRGEVWGTSTFEAAEFTALPSHALRHPLNVQRLWLEMESAVFR